MTQKDVPFYIKYLLLFILPFFVSACSGQAPTEMDVQPKVGELKILFIGSSYLSFNNLPSIFMKLAAAKNKEIFIHTNIINGKYLDYHATSSSTTEAIKQQEWDFVILQGGCHNIAYPETHHLIIPPYEKHPVKSSIAALNIKIKQNYSETKTVYFMPWAFEDGTTWISGQNDTYQTMQRHIYNNTLEMRAELDLVIAPIGWAWNSIMMEENHELHYLYLSDYNHPSIKGSYLAACTVYATLFGESVESNSYLAGISENEAKHFQTIASSISLNYKDLWNIEIK